VLPLGTENLLAKYLSVGPVAEDVAEMVAEGWHCRFDAGRAISSSGGRPTSRVFSLMAGVGFDADVVRRMDENRTGHIRHLSYAKPIWSAIRSYRYPELRVCCQDIHGRVEEEIRARWVFVANLPQYAGNLKIVPDADGMDSLLDVCTFKRGSMWDGLRYLSAILMRRHRNWNDVQMVQTPRVRIESEGAASFQLDGDYGGELPVEVEVLPARLTIVTPRRWFDQHRIELPSTRSALSPGDGEATAE
jgi:diacylglycerol kinase family enzyme